jgi:hypothetical protein
MSASASLRDQMIAFADEQARRHARDGDAEVSALFRQVMAKTTTHVIVGGASAFAVGAPAPFPTSNTSTTSTLLTNAARAAELQIKSIPISKEIAAALKKQGITELPLINPLSIAEEPNDLKNYFNAMYVPSSKLVIYGPGGKSHVVNAEEGVRQGDAASTLLFCKVMDEACAELQRRYPSVTVWSYVDDLTIACAPEMAKEVANAIREILAAQGFRVNLTKSAVTAKSIENIETIQKQETQSEITVLAPSEPFHMLGAIINFERHLPKRWKDLDHTSGYKALPSAEPTPESTVVLKAAASTGAKLMRAALESIGYELVKWSPLVAQIKKKDEAANLHPASIPYEFTGQFKGLILDYEDSF